ncbi:aminotransferase class V-fold PLP-dependent enzyme [Candidatus Cyrtobacter comes]|uniref:aminotransferase class V-fold PLP-dependent enzyme n=1 Tax=Candidatus Cyrtobacter comes TaxID=675776 RepID=UPI002ACEA683|nr:aminotransferase class V-fold PLP-dependent enzyme [Candidatus Cyrtobacter comes]
MSTKGRYAVMSMIEVASLGLDAPVQLSKISESQGIGIAYLEKIFSNLKRANIVSSFKGPGGGYSFTNRDITVLDIIRAAGEKIEMTRCRGAGCMPGGIVCKAHKIWEGIENNIISYLSSLRISEIAGLKDHAELFDPLGYKGIIQDKVIYFDNNATTAPLSEVAATMVEILPNALNPSSVHMVGKGAKKILERARANILKKLNAGDDYKLIFTSSGTEANNMAISSFDRCFTSSIEHSSVLNNPKAISCIPVLKNGQIDLSKLEEAVSKIGDKNTIVSVMMANNETGVLQPIHEVLNICSAYGVYLHTDAIQCMGRIKIDLSETQVDMISISAHKFGGPTGVGALIYKKSIEPSQIMFGGNQEYNLRPGTYNIVAIRGFEAAVEELQRSISLYAKTSELRDYIENKILSISKGNAIIFGKDSPRLPNTSSIGMVVASAQAQLIHFDMDGIMLSAGSACSSGAMRTPYVQAAMGYEEKIANSAIRISLSPANTIKEADRFICAWETMYSRFY